VLKVVPPVRPNSSLTTNVPHVQLEASRLDTLDVETLSNILFSIISVVEHLLILVVVAKSKLEWFCTD